MNNQFYLSDTEIFSQRASSNVVTKLYISMWFRHQQKPQAGYLKKKKDSR